MCRNDYQSLQRVDSPNEFRRSMFFSLTASSLNCGKASNGTWEHALSRS